MSCLNCNCKRIKNDNNDGSKDDEPSNNNNNNNINNNDNNLPSGVELQAESVESSVCQMAKSRPNSKKAQKKEELENKSQMMEAVTKCTVLLTIAFVGTIACGMFNHISKMGAISQNFYTEWYFCQRFVWILNCLNNVICLGLQMNFNENMYQKSCKCCDKCCRKCLACYAMRKMIK